VFGAGKLLQPNLTFAVKANVCREIGLFIPNENKNDVIQGAG
jgi:hypothetical protein